MYLYLIPNLRSINYSIIYLKFKMPRLLREIFEYFALKLLGFQSVTVYMISYTSGVFDNKLTAHKMLGHSVKEVRY